MSLQEKTNFQILIIYYIYNPTFIILYLVSKFQEPPTMVYLEMRLAPCWLVATWRFSLGSPSLSSWWWRVTITYYMYMEQTFEMCVPQRNTPDLTVASWMDFHSRAMISITKSDETKCCSNQLRRCLAFTMLYSDWLVFSWLFPIDAPLPPKKQKNRSVRPWKGTIFNFWSNLPIIFPEQAIKLPGM